MFLGLALAEWLLILKGLLAFPDKILAVVKLFQATPEEQHDALIAKIAVEAERFKYTGRPS